MDFRNQKPKTDLYKAIVALPKIELHRHLEGSLRLGTIAEFARKHQIDLPGYEIEDFRHLVQVVPEDAHKADIFLSKFETLRKVFSSREMIERIAYEAVADAAVENIVYMELRFTPIALARARGFELGDVIDWVIESVRQGMKDYDIQVGLIVSMNRNESVELGDQKVDLAIERMGQGIVGVDLAGAEHKFPGAPFVNVFKKAHDAGLPVTIHAGEWAGPESVREAIDVLGAARLGHGVRAVEDPELLTLIKERGLAFEVCPTSNIQTGVIDEITRHPLRELYQGGQLTTINTDDPGVSAINLTDELVLAVEELGMTINDVKQNILNAARVAFLPEDERANLIARLNSELFVKPAEEKASRGH